ncbi:MAG: DUF4403 family protein [Nitrospira sp.]
MVLASRYHVLATMGLILSLTGCSDTDFIMRPPAPEKFPPADAPTPEITESVINVPIQLGLSDFLQAANDPTVIAKQFDHWGRLTKHPNGGEFKYYAERGEFTIEQSGSQQAGIAAPGKPSQTGSLGDWWKGIDLSGSSLYVSAPLRYKIGLRPHAVGAAPGQCGDGPDGPRHAALTGNIALAMTPRYGVAASVREVTVTPLDPCRLSATNLDPQGAVNAKLSDHVKGGFHQAVSFLNALTVKPRAEEVWSALRNPIPLEEDAWLLLNIEKMGHRGFSKAGHTLHNTLEITARPVIVRGAEPFATPAVLPRLETEPSSADFRGVADVPRDSSQHQPSAKQFHVLADVPIDYGTFSKRVADRLRGKRIVHERYVIRVTGAAVSGLGANQVLLRVDFAGDAHGHLYLIGKPEINMMTQTVYISGLRYDLKTAQLFQAGAPDWLHHAPLREVLTPEIMLGVKPMVDQWRDLLQTGLNRTLSPMVSMEGTVTSMSGIAVFADTDALHVHAVSDGTLNVMVGNEP